MKIKILILGLCLFISNSFSGKIGDVWVDTSNCFNNYKQIYTDSGVMFLTGKLYEYAKTGKREKHKDDEVIKEVNDRIMKDLKDKGMTNAIKYIKHKHNGYYAAAVYSFYKGVESVEKQIEFRMKSFNLTPLEAMEEMYEASYKALQLYYNALNKCPID